MAWYSFLTATPKAVGTSLEIVKKAAEGIIAGVDALVYTPEEKAKALQKATETIISLWKALASENSEQSKARREIANKVIDVYFVMIFMSIAVYGFNPALAEFILGYIGKITSLVTGVSFIYFGPHQIQKLLNK